MEDSDSLTNSSLALNLATVMYIYFVELIRRMNILSLPNDIPPRQGDKSTLCLSLIMKYRQLKPEERQLKFMSVTRVLYSMETMEVFVSCLGYLYYSYKTCPTEFLEPFLSSLKFADSQSKVIQNVVSEECSHSLPHTFRISLVDSLLARLEKLLNQEVTAPNERMSCTLHTLISAIFRLNNVTFYDTIQNPSMSLQLMKCLQQLYDLRNKLCIKTDIERITNIIANLSSMLSLVA